MENIDRATPLEAKILGYIRAFILRHQHAPTLSEIGTALGIQSKGTVHRYVQTLVNKGLLAHTERGWRGLRLTGTPPSHPTLPLVGRIAAGRPIEAIAQRDEVSFGNWLLEDRFALEVKGDSMIEAGILDGDIVIVKRQNNARDGDIVVALIDQEEATLKLFKRSGSADIKLIPANSTMGAMLYPVERVEIQGIVIGQMRNYGQA